MISHSKKMKPREKERKISVSMAHADKMEMSCRSPLDSS